MMRPHAPPAGGRVRRFSIEVAAVVALIAVLGAAATLTWGTWGDWKSDTGYDLYVGSRALHGSLPYRDVAYYYGPVTPTVLAGIFAAFGESLNAAIAGGLLVCTALVILTYAAARTRLGVRGSWCSAALLASGVVCRPGLFNGVLPYSWSASLGACGLLAGALALVSHIRYASRLSAIGCGLAIALEGLIKPEYAVYLGVVALAILALRALTGEDTPILSGLAVVAATVPPLVVYGGMVAVLGAGKVLSEGILPTSQLTAAGLHAIESDAPLTLSSIASLVGRAGAYVACAFALGWLARSNVLRHHARRIFVATAGGAAVLFAILIASTAGDDIAEHGSSTIIFGHSLPVWLVRVALDARTVRGQAGWIAQELSRSYSWLYLLVLLTSLAIVVRRVLPALVRRRPVASDTQTLLVVALIPAVAGAARYTSLAPSRNDALLLPLALILLVELHLRVVARESQSARIAGVAWLAILVIAGLGSSARDAARFTTTVRAERGSFRALASDANAYQGALDAIAALGRNPSVVVAPEGTGLLFLSGAHTPLRQPTLLPGSFTSAAKEREASAEVTRDPPQAAVIIERPLTEFGHGLFGETFLSDLAGALRKALPATFRYVGAPPGRTEIEVRQSGRIDSRANAIVRENQRIDGLSTTGWRLDHPSDATVAYATQTSVAMGTSISLRVSSSRRHYSVSVWRAGWYGAPGVMRRVASLMRSAESSGASANARVGCSRPIPSTGLVRCPWRTTEAIPTRGWASGVYLINVRGDDGGMSQTVVIVRDDASRSDVLYQASTATWQAYNGWGGKSLYTFNSVGRPTVSGSSRAIAVSFDRPYANVSSILEFNWFLRSELPLIAWLERLGYDVSYTDDLAVSQEPGFLKRHRALVVSGHDEYWSASHRNGIEAAVAAGVSLANFSANTGYWKIRFTKRGRTMVCYKTSEGPSGVRDPVSPTSLWRDPELVGRPENALTGGMYVGDGDEGADHASFPLVLSKAAARDPLMRDVRSLGTPLGSAIVGWEWDATFPNSESPPGLRVLARSPTHGVILWVRGVPTADGAATREPAPVSGRIRSGYLEGRMEAVASAYRARSGALVFSAGTNQWAWGLEPMGFRYRYSGGPNVGREIQSIQQITTNVLAAMGAVPSRPRAAPAVRLHP